MRGLFVVGTGPGAREREVAGALEAAAGAAGARAMTFAAGDLEATAPPAIAARHAGAELDPERLMEEARAAAESGRASGGAAASGEDDALFVVATSGGLLAPITERYSNRDFAVEIGAPLVVATPALSGLMNATLLTLEAARGAGLAPAAVVIGGWPEQPPRALLDERAALERRIALPLEQPPAKAPEGWPVLDGAAGASAGGSDDAPAHVSLDSYDAWEERPVGDPRQAARAEIMRAIIEIVAAEGPMRASRAYALYNRASGGRKLTSVARAPLSSAVYWLAQERRVVLTRKEEIPWQDDDLVRLPDTPPVRVRELGPRTLEEVPLDEIAELARRMSTARGTADATELKRAILSTYGLVRLTSRADEYLGLALDLAGVA
jgi:dethiobiotin synthetase